MEVSCGECSILQRRVSPLSLPTPTSISFPHPSLKSYTPPAMLLGLTHVAYIFVSFLSVLFHSVALSSIYTYLQSFGHTPLTTTSARTNASGAARAKNKIATTAAALTPRNRLLLIILLLLSFNRVIHNSHQLP